MYISYLSFFLTTFKFAFRRHNKRNYRKYNLFNAKWIIVLNHVLTAAFIINLKVLSTHMGRVSHCRKNPVSPVNGEHWALSIMQRSRLKIWIPKDSAGLCRVFGGGKQHVYNNILLILMTCATITHVFPPVGK